MFFFRICIFEESSMFLTDFVVEKEEQVSFHLKMVKVEYVFWLFVDVKKTSMFHGPQFALKKSMYLVGLECL